MSPRAFDPRRVPQLGPQPGGRGVVDKTPPGYAAGARPSTRRRPERHGRPGKRTDAGPIFAPLPAKINLCHRDELSRKFKNIIYKKKNNPKQKQNCRVFKLKKDYFR